MAIFTLDGTIEYRRARMTMIARSKEHECGFRMSYHDHTGTSIFNRSVEGEHDHLKFGSYIYFPKGSEIIPESSESSLSPL